MSSHAKCLGARSGLSYLARARERWGDALPDWVSALAEASDRCRELGQSQGDLGRKIGLSGALISAIIGKSYLGRYETAEAKVRGALMAVTVACPVEGEIGRDRCASNQRLKFSAANPVRARFPSACKSCPNRIAEHSK